MNSSRCRMCHAVLFVCAVLAATPGFATALEKPHSPAQQEQESPALELTRAAEQLLRSGNPEEALAEIDKALAEDENFAGAYYVGGLAYGQTGRLAEARDYFVRATELRPGWGEAHRFASTAFADTGDFEAAWEHAIKAHQAGVDMSDAFTRLQGSTAAPDDLDTQLAAARVFVGGYDTERLERGGTNTNATAAMGRAAGDLFQVQEEARRQLSSSRSFGLVQRQDMARYIMIFEIDSLSTRRLVGVLKLVDAQSGEEAYRRRIDLTDITSRSYLNREFSRIIALMEEWAAESVR